MPKKLKVHPNERIDLSDFDVAANSYTKDSLNFHRKEFLSSTEAQILRGFRIEVADQTTLPGQITIHNGVALDRSGELFTEEGTLSTSSRTVTLLGANLSFYLEIEFTEEESDLDDRAFWDPTFDSGSGTLGKEFVDTVPTRVTPSWRVVSPISTTGFDAVTNVNSRKVPLAILSTDSAGEITVAANPGLVLESGRSVLQEDAPSGATSVKVFDSSTLPFTGTVDIGGQSVTLTSNNIVTNVLTFNSTPLTSAKSAGTIVFNNQTGAPQFVQENTSGFLVDSEFVAATSTHPDKRRKYFTGDEVRGRALLSSKVTATDRDETQLQNLKDRIDSLAAVIKELKAGRILSTDTVTPPDYSTSPVSKPYYTNTVGSLQGSRTVHFTIGDGVTSLFGDFIGNDETPFTSALASAAAAGYSHVVLHVHPGTYTLANPITPGAINLTMVGAFHGDALGAPVLTGTGTSGFSLQNDPVSLSFRDITFDDFTGGPIFSANGTSIPAFTFERCKFQNLASNLILSSSLGGSFALKIRECNFDLSALTQSAFSLSNTVSISGYIKDSQIKLGASTLWFMTCASGSLGATTDSFLIDNSVFYTDSGSGAGFFNVSSLVNFSVRNCVFDADSNQWMFIIGGSASDHVEFRSTKFRASGPFFDLGYISFSGLAKHVAIVDCEVDTTISGATVDQTFLFSGGVDGLTITGTRIQQESNAGVVDSVIEVNDTCYDAVISGNEIYTGTTLIDTTAIKLENVKAGNISITNNTIQGWSTAIKVILDEPVDRFKFAPTLDISDNTISWADPNSVLATFSLSGIVVYPNTVSSICLTTKITGNTIYSGGTDTGASHDITGIFVDGIITEPTVEPTVQVCNNTISNLFAKGPAAKCSGIDLLKITIAGTTGYAIDVSHNKISAIDATYDVHGIQVDQVSPSASSIRVEGNDLVAVGSGLVPLTSSSKIGIRVVNDFGGLILNNTMTGIGTSTISGSGLVAGINCGGTGNDCFWDIRGNKINTARAALSADRDSFVGILTTVGDLLCADNTVYSSHGIRHTVGTETVKSIRIKGNFIDCKGDGIYTNDIDTATQVEQVLVADNNITCSLADVAYTGIELNTEAYNTIVSGNNILETVTQTDAGRGIWVFGGISCVIRGNNIYTTATTQPATTNRTGIYCSDLERLIIEGNISFWSPSRVSTNAVANQAEIYVVNINAGVVISGNVLQSTSGQTTDCAIYVASVILHIINNNAFNGLLAATHLRSNTVTTGIPDLTSGAATGTGGAADDNY